MNSQTRDRLWLIVVSLMLAFGALGLLRAVEVQAAQTSPLAQLAPTTLPHTIGAHLSTSHPISLTPLSAPAPLHITTATATASPAGWSIECVDCPKYFETLTDRSLRLDPNGHPAIAYGGDHLYYAYNDGSTWHFTTVDSSPEVGTEASLALDGSNNPHISYYDTTNADLKYAYQDAAGWHIQTVDSGGDVGTYSSVALDGNRYAHISYYDATNNNLKYAYQDGSGWHLQTVDTYSGKYTSLVLDGNGYAHISHSGLSLYYTYQDSFGWHNTTIESGILSQVFVGANTSLALDGQGYAHISYNKDDERLTIPYSLKYAYQTASGWYSQTVDFYAHGMGTTSLALDGNTRPRIAYIVGGALGYTSFLSYAYYDGSTWHSRLTDPGLALDNGSSSTSLALNGSGYPRLVYLDKWNLKYIYQDISGWYAQSVDTAADVGSFSSLRLDVSDYPHVSYAGNVGLKYSRKDAGGWSTEIVDGNDGDPAGGTYQGTSLVLDMLDDPHIGYGGWNELRYANHDVSSWVTQTIVSGDIYALGTSMAVDQNGYAHLTYGNGAGLFYEYQDGSGWHAEQPDSSSDVFGSGTSLALDGNDYPYVTYVNGTTGDLCYIYKDGTGWHKFSWSGAAGTTSWSHTSLVLDVDGYPHISYYDSTNGDLKYLFQDASGWWIATPDSTGDVGDYSSLALDIAEYPHISYYDKTNGDLKYAYQDASGWHIQTIDSSANVGKYTSLALDSNDYPHISYYDVTNRDLKYAFYAPPAGVPTLLSPANGALTTTQTITLAWEAGTGGTPLGYNVQVDSATITTTQTTSSTILSLGTHTWSVRAYNANGYSDWTTAWTIAITQPVAIPILLTPPNGSLTLHNLTFSWQAGAGSAPVGYNLQVDGSLITTTNTTSATVLSNGVHTWTVRAFNLLGYSAWVAPSWTVEVTDTLPAPNTPILLSPPSGTITTSRTIAFAWQANAGATPLGYNVQVDSGRVITVTGTTSATVLAEGLHTWTVRAYNNVGYSAWASPWSIEVHLYHIYLPLVLRGP